MESRVTHTKHSSFSMKAMMYARYTKSTAATSSPISTSNMTRLEFKNPGCVFVGGERRKKSDKNLGSIAWR